jgi:hypothetical protein
VELLGPFFTRWKSTPLNRRAVTQWRAGEVAHCFDEKTYHAGIPIDPFDGGFPILGHNVGRVTGLYAQSRDCAHWRLYDRALDRAETCVDCLELSCLSFNPDLVAQTLNARAERP